MDSDLLKLEVRQSNIPNAGNGVFTKCDIIKDEIICEYRGLIVQVRKGHKTKAERAEENKDINLDGEYVIRGNSVAAMINDCIDFKKYNPFETISLLSQNGLLTYNNLEHNCKYEKMGDKQYVIAIRDIKRDEELYVSYGINYWIPKFIRNNLLCFTKTILKNIVNN